MHGGAMACPGTTTALEKMVVPAHEGHMGYTIQHFAEGGAEVSAPVCPPRQNLTVPHQIVDNTFAAQRESSGNERTDGV